MVRLMVADAQFIVRVGVKQLCRDMGDVIVTGEAENGDELLEVLSKEQFDMLVFEPNILRRAKFGIGDTGDTGGLSLLRRIRAKHPTLPILAFSASNDPRVAKLLLNNGAKGFVAKDGDQAALVEALRTVARGQRYIDSDIAAMMMFEKEVDRRAVLRERVSERELQVMKLFVQGKSLNAIAGELYISNRTVSTHKTRLMQKMNFKTNVELMRYAVEIGLTEAGN